MTSAAATENTWRVPRIHILEGLRGVRRKDMPRELSAGVTLLALAVPLNIGYAQIAGLPPTAGLYTLIVPSLAFALLTTSRQLVAAPDAAAAALVASSLTGLADVGTEHYIDLAAQALVGGAIFALCWLFRLGFLANFCPRPSSSDSSAVSRSRSCSARRPRCLASPRGRGVPRGASPAWSPSYPRRTAGRSCSPRSLRESSWVDAGCREPSLGRLLYWW